MIHVLLLCAVQGQPVPEVTPNVPVPPAPEIVAETGLIAYVHPSAWLIVDVSPATVIVPVRAGPLLAATKTFTGPLPAPVAPNVIEIHALLLVAVQVQLLPAVTLIAPPPPPFGNVPVLWFIEYMHPSWLTVNVCPATVIVPVRLAPLVFPATV